MRVRFPRTIAAPTDSAAHFPARVRCPLWTRLLQHSPTGPKDDRHTQRGSCALALARPPRIYFVRCCAVRQVGLRRQRFPGAVPNEHRTAGLAPLKVQQLPGCLHVAGSLLPLLIFTNDYPPRQRFGELLDLECRGAGRRCARRRCRSFGRWWVGFVDRWQRGA